MDYNKIVAVTGLSGLFELVSSKSDGGVVRSLEDKTSKFVSNRIHSFSHLESIEVYTVKDNVNLVDVFDAMKASKEKMPNSGDAKAVKAYFEKVYPEMDFERVYNSDMKKMVKWYEALNKAGVEIKLSQPADNGAEEKPEEVKAEPEKPAKAEKKVSEKKAAAAPKSTATAKAAPPKKITGPRKMS